MTALNVLQLQPSSVFGRIAAKDTINTLKPGQAAAFDVQRADKRVELSINPGVRPRPQRNVRR